MNKLDKDYQDLLRGILKNGSKKLTRNGGVLSSFGCQIRHNMNEGFPLLTTKKMHWPSIVTELLWFLRGDSNIKYLVDNDCHIWDGDCFASYVKMTGINFDEVLPKNKAIAYESKKKEFINNIKASTEFAKESGDLGAIYGKQWRRWEYGDDIAFKTGETYPNGKFKYEFRKRQIDQIQVLINDLKTDPDSRRLMVTAWDPSKVDSKNAVLPPCHYGFQCYTREMPIEERISEWCLSLDKNIHYGDDMDHSRLDGLGFPRRKISLLWNQRSCDVPLGLPFNIASYGLLLSILGKECGMIPDELIGNLGDCHIYLNQIDGVKEQLTRTPYKLPKLAIQLHWENIPSFVPENWIVSDFKIENYKFHPVIKIPLSN